MSVETEFQRRLESKLDKVYAEKQEQLAWGICTHAANTGEEYTTRCGYLKAIRDIADIIKEVSKSLHGDGESKKEDESSVY